MPDHTFACPFENTKGYKKRIEGVTGAMDALFDPRPRTDELSNIFGSNMQQHEDRRYQQHNSANQFRSTSSEQSAQLSMRNYPHAFAMMNEIATVYGSQSWEFKAKDLEDKIVLSCAKALHEGDMNAIASFDGLVALYISQGRSHEAVELENKIIGIYIGLFGEGHDYTLAAMEGLMATYGIQGRSSEREEMRERIVVIKRKWQSGGHHVQRPG